MHASQRGQFEGAGLHMGRSGKLRAVLWETMQECHATFVICNSRHHECISRDSVVCLTLTNGELFQETVHRIHIIAMRSFVSYGISTALRISRTRVHGASDSAEHDQVAGPAHVYRNCVLTSRRRDDSNACNTKSGKQRSEGQNSA